MNEIRCGNCQRKLGEGVYTHLAIKCPRCKALNQLCAQSAPPERQSASHPEGKYGKSHYKPSACKTSAR
ncbi:MAG: Com family DNA-binding transcriptional regulator [Burkholderiaceae bacterium]|nr:Com family DNA-binding transcriptional regulator [Burkholderiaceae bacterium]MBY0455648.1 Com family DNA-binding transcriptional regulator [Burkholderiaceae bacterium]